MKGKISFYYDAPNVSKIRTRINPTQEFTAKMRTAIQEVTVEVLNEQTYAIRTKLIQKFANMGEVVKDEKYAAQLNSALSSFFDVRCQLTPFCEEESVEEASEEEAPVDQDEQPKTQKAPKAPKPKKDEEGFDD